MTVVLFAGGGTGGHLMPALAIAEAMVRLDPAVQPFFVGSRRGVEASVLPQRPWRFELLPLEPIWRRRWWRNVALPVALARSFARIRAILARENPALVVGTGGYAAGPVVWAAVNRGVPAALQEQNAYPGVTTRWLSRRARQVHLGMPEARAHLRFGPATEVLDSGNPIPPPPPPAARRSRSEAKRALGFPPEAPLVFVTGGSQGALPINRALAEALRSGIFPRASLLWQTGPASLAEFAPLAVPGRVRIEGFVDPIADAYAAADLVVSRSGAMTLAGHAAWGAPSILIPLPTSAAGHQLANARALAETGAAELLQQPRMDAGSLADAIRALLADPARMADMSARVLERARPDAASNIAAKVLELARKN